MGVEWMDKEDPPRGAIKCELGTAGKKITFGQEVSTDSIHFCYVKVNEE